MPDGLIGRLNGALTERYVVERLVGQGGTASVYRARDVRHDRTVALKVLRPELASVLGTERFMREIRVAAQLNHPNILPLHDSGQADGLLFYAMPFVGGESLRTTLEREAQLSLEAAVDLARQVAAALDHAHAQGIVHRDIKPENILLHEGVALVSDFGIALAVQAAGGDRVTAAGLSLGTPAYMSPEQATGDLKIDARADIYSLGCVVYEMLAGEPPFTGATAQAIIAKLLTQRPVPLRALRPSLPEHIEAAVERALARASVDRFGAAGAFVRALEQAQTPNWRPHRRRLTRSLLAVAGAVAAVIAAVLGIPRMRSSARPAVRSERQLTATGDAWGVALSPDGQTVAYYAADATQLVVQDVAGGRSLTLVEDSAGLAPAQAIQWSPSGSKLLFGAMEPYGYYVIPRLGGDRQLVVNFNAILGFAGDDSTFILGNGRRIYVGTAPATAFSTRDTVRPDGALLDVGAATEWVWGPTLSPDRRWIAFRGERHDGSSFVGIMSSDGRRSSILDDHLERGGPPADYPNLYPSFEWGRGSDAVYYARPQGSGWSIWRRGMNPRTGAPAGQPMLVAERMPSFLRFSRSADGRRWAYSGGVDRAAVHRFPLTPEGMPPQILTAGNAYSRSPTISAGGDIVAYLRRTAAGSADVYTVRLRGGVERRVTRSAAVLGPPTWSPDGRQLAVVAETDSGPRLMISDVATSTLTRAGTETASTHGMTAWSPDGRRLMYQLASYRNYGILDLETGTETRLVANDSVGWMFYPVYAPDGDHVVVQWHRPPSSGLWSISLKDGAQRELTSGNEIPLLWTGNGTIYFARFSGGLAGGGTIARMRAAGGRPSTVAAMPVSCTRGELSITPDARMAVCTVTTQASDVWIVENFDPKSR